LKGVYFKTQQDSYGIQSKIADVHNRYKLIPRGEHTVQEAFQQIVDLIFEQKIPDATEEAYLKACMTSLKYAHTVK